MRFLGIGTLELVMIVLLGLLLVGPTDMVRLARKAGIFLRQMKDSELWRSIQGSQRSIKRMGQELMSEVDPGLNSVRKELSNIDFTAGADPEELSKLPGWKPKETTFDPPETTAAPASEQPAAEAAPSEGTEQQS